MAPASNGWVGVWLESANFGTSGKGSSVAPDGRYAVEIPDGVARVRLFSRSHHQPCAVTLDIAAGVLSADIDLIQDPDYRGANLPASLRSRAPTLSGVVYEQTAQGRRPIPDASLELDAAEGLGLPIADTVTDAEGRYLFCAVPPIRGLAITASVPGFDLFVSGPAFNQTTLDLELHRQ